MNTLGVIITIVIVVIIVVAVAASIVARRRRSAHLRERFGPEYRHTVERARGRRAAEKDLREREKRRASYQIRPLGDGAAAQYREEWTGIQQRFVDQPAEAVQQADLLVARMMRESGYPMDDFEHRAGDISVDHPEVAQHYREAHAVAVAQLDGTADTEQMRQAVTRYRELVDVLLRNNAA